MKINIVKYLTLKAESCILKLDISITKIERTKMKKIIRYISFAKFQDLVDTLKIQSESRNCSVYVNERSLIFYEGMLAVKNENYPLDLILHCTDYDLKDIILNILSC